MSNIFWIDEICMKELNVDELPSVPYRGAETIIEAPCIYFVVTDRDIILYVGKAHSNDVFKDHHRLVDFQVHQPAKVAYWKVAHQHLAYYESQLNLILNGLLRI